MTHKVGLLVVATNKYIDFVFPLWESAKKHFLPEHDVTMFVFTDKINDPRFKDEPKIQAIYQQHMPWPGSTLFRYNIFDSAKKELEQMDYLFYSDADMLFVDTVGTEILGDRVGTIHPGFFDKPRQAFTYETNKVSKAFVAPEQGTTYYAGGFNGGSKAEYLQMCKVLSENIADDYRRGVIAVWHDESHLNRYFIDNPPTVSLSPSYCYPESWDLVFTKRLLALDKNHKEMRT
jgi:histo-blood group ABO system transferase